MRAQAQGGPTGPLGDPSASQPLPRPPPPRGFPQQAHSCLLRAEHSDSINLLQQLCTLCLRQAPNFSIMNLPSCTRCRLHTSPLNIPPVDAAAAADDASAGGRRGSAARRARGVCSAPAAALAPAWAAAAGAAGAVHLRGDDGRADAAAAAAARVAPAGAAWLHAW